MLASTLSYTSNQLYIHFGPLSRLRRHINLRPRTNSILTLPKAGNSLLLRIKVQPGLAIESIRAAARDTLLIAGETEHGQGDGDGDVDADLPGLDFFLELARCGARRGEDGGAVAVFVLVDQFDGFVQAVDVEADEDGAEDFFAVAAHGFRYVGDDCWADLSVLC